MKKLMVLGIVVFVLVGCRTTNHNDFYAGVDYSVRDKASATSVGIGFQGRPMFSPKIGLAYQVGFNIPVMMDYQANGLSVTKSDLPTAVGFNGFVGPSFKVADFNDRIGLYITPGLNLGVNVFNHHTEVKNGYKTEILTQSLGIATLGVGVDFSSDFYFGKSFMMRLGVTMGLDFFTTDTIQFGSIDKSYNNGIAQFRVYPKIGIGWRKTREQKISNTIDMNTPDVYEYTFTDNKPYYKIARLWLAETISDAKESIDFEDEEMQIIKGELSVGSTMNLKWMDYTIRVKGNQVSITFNNYRQGTAKIGVLTHGEHQSFKKHTDAIAESLYNYIQYFE